MITQIPAPGYSPQEPQQNGLSNIERAKLREAATILTSYLPWVKTAEGDDFWRGVWNRLKAIADGEPLK